MNTQTEPTEKQETQKNTHGIPTTANALRMLFNKSLAQLSDDELEFMSKVGDNTGHNLFNLNTWVLTTGCLVNESESTDPLNSDMADIMFVISDQLDVYGSALRVGMDARYYLDQRRKAGAE